MDFSQKITQEKFQGITGYKKTDKAGKALSEYYLACPSGFEPETFGSGGQRSIQLSYGHLYAAIRVPRLRLVVKRVPLFARSITAGT